jgi:hypothetical protein
MRSLTYSAIIIGLFFAIPAYARLQIAPYASISSTKKISPADAGKEDSKNVQRQTYGIRASFAMFRLLKIQASVGQNETTTVTKTQDAVDEYEEIDYEKDLEMSTDDPDREVKISETQRLGRLGIVLDPGFWILIARAQAGVQATQRIVELQEGTEAAVKTEEPITYKPYAGAGLGVRLSPRLQAMAEYNIYMYKFPEYEPFEREVTVSFIVALGSGK